MSSFLTVVPSRRFGTVIEVHIPIDKETKRGKGYAYVEMEGVAEAILAREKLDATIFAGR